MEFSCYFNVMWREPRLFIPVKIFDENEKYFNVEPLGQLHPAPGQHVLQRQHGRHGPRQPAAGQPSLAPQCLHLQPQDIQGD